MAPDSRLPLLHPEALDGDQIELRSRIAEGPRAADRSRSPITDEHGRLLGPFNAMLFNPQLGDPLQGLGAALRYRTSLSDRQRELAILLIAATLESGFEWFAHEPLARAAGVGDGVIAALAAGTEPTALEPEDAVVLRSVDALLDGGDLDDERYHDLHSVFGDAGCVELVVLVGYYRMLAMLLQTFRVPVPEGAGGG
jgi:4-carboxymuconolactone decarboxylase